MTRKNAKFISASLAVLIAFIILLFIKPNKIEAPIESIKTEINNDQAEKTEALSRIPDYQYSRVTFFNGRPVRASLAVPSHWEGHYRLKEQGNEAVFYYIGDDKEDPFLWIRLFKEDEMPAMSVLDLPAGSKDSYLAFYRQTVMEENSQDKIKNTMISEIPDVVGSLKLR
jgi:hypothetical protein